MTIDLTAIPTDHEDLDHVLYMSHTVQLLDTLPGLHVIKLAGESILTGYPWLALGQEAAKIAAQRNIEFADEIAAPLRVRVMDTLEGMNKMTQEEMDRMNRIFWKENERLAALVPEQHLRTFG